MEEQINTFKYFDSSEDEAQQTYQQEHLQTSLPYEDSSSDALSQNLEFQVAYPNKAGGKKQECKLSPDEFLLNDNYIQSLQRIVRQNKQKILKKTPLLLDNCQKQILQNLEKRTKNYGFFLRTLDIDKRYSGLVSKKVQKLKHQNERKKRVLKSKKQESKIRKENAQMKGYVLSKKSKEQIVIAHVQKHAYKLGIERVRQQEKKVKGHVKEIEQSNEIRNQNLQILQKNQIEELREELQRMKTINRVNKIEQVKVIKDMEKNNQKDKQLLVTKALSDQGGKFIF